MNTDSQREREGDLFILFSQCCSFRSFMMDQFHPWVVLHSPPWLSLQAHGGQTSISIHTEESFNHPLNLSLSNHISLSILLHHPLLSTSWTSDSPQWLCLLLLLLPPLSYSRQATFYLSFAGFDVLLPIVPLESFTVAYLLVSLVILDTSSHDSWLWSSGILSLPFEALPTNNLYNVMNTD